MWSTPCIRYQTAVFGLQTLANNIRGKSTGLTDSINVLRDSLWLTFERLLIICLGCAHLLFLCKSGIQDMGKERILARAAH